MTNHTPLTARTLARRRSGPLATATAFLASAMVGMGGMQSAHAAAYTWTGATSGDLNTTTNWSTNGNPSGNNLIFSNNTNTTIGITSDITIASIADGISFNSGAGSFTIGASGTGRIITFGSTVTNNGINVSSGVTTDQTINANLTFGGDNTVRTFRIQNNGTGLLKINGTVGSGGTGKTLTLAGTGNIEFTDVIGRAASTAMNMTGTGIVTMSGANTYAGKVAVSSGVLVFQKTQANSIATAGTNTVAAGATIGLGVGGSGYYGVSNVTDLFNGTLAEFSSISATANVGIDTTAGSFNYTASAPSTTRGLMKLGANTLTLSGNNAYTGVTTVRAGTLAVNSTGVINNAAISGGTGIVIGGSTLDINGGTVNFNGANALAIGDNTTAGNVIVRAGSNLNLTGAIPIGQGSTGSGNTPVSTFTQYGGTTTIGASSTLYLGNYRGTTMDIQGGSLTSSSSANIGVRGNSTLTISGASTAVTFTTIALGNASGATTATSDVNLNGGTLTLGASGITKAATTGVKTVSFDGGKLQASATSPDFVNADFVYVKTGGATIDTNTFDVTIDNPLLQFGATTGALTKAGAGTLTLTGANSYTGATTVNGGTLNVQNSLATSGVTINANGTLNLSASGTLGGGTVTVNGGTLDLNSNNITNTIDYQSGIVANMGGAMTTNVKSGAALNTNNMSIGGTVNVLSGGLLSGTGTVSTLNVAGTVGPGNSPGLFTSGTTTWQSTGSYHWEVANITGTGAQAGGGTNFDLWNITGDLAITNGFKVSINTDGAQPGGWNANNSYSWLIADVAGTTTNFTGLAFSVDNFSWATGGTWALSQSGNDVWLNYTAVIPEPGTLGLLAFGALALLGRRKKRG